MTGRPPAQERAHEQVLRDKYRDDALGRLVRANDKYLREHFYYLPEVAALLLIEREEHRAAVRDADTLAEALRPFAEEWDFHAADYLAHDSSLRVIEASTIDRITAAIDNARALLASRAAGQEQV